MTMMSPSTGPHQRALTQVALDILRRKPGERITKSLELQEQLGVGSGTVQKALRELIDAGAVRLRVKGHQGTVILEQNLGLLWRRADLGPLRLTLTPPGSIEQTALALQVRSQLLRHQVSTEFDFVRGARNRLALLDAGTPRVAALSWVAAQGAGVMDNPDYAFLDLGPFTYYRPETLLVLDAAKPAGALRRVARDSESDDHVRLTALLVPEMGDFEYVECPFPEVPAAILTGKADTGVWHQVVSAISPEQAGLSVTHMDQLGTGLGDDAISRAVLVWRSEYAEIGAMLSLLDVPAIAKEQERLAALGIASPTVRELVPWL